MLPFDISAFTEELNNVIIKALPQIKKIYQKSNQIITRKGILLNLIKNNYNLKLTDFEVFL